MKTKIVVSLAIAGIVLIVAEDNSRKEEAPTLERLNSRIIALEKRLAEIETRAFPVPVAEASHLPVILDKDCLVKPPNVGSISVNGLEVFKIPLAREHPPQPIE